MRPSWMVIACAALAGLAMGAPAWAQAKPDNRWGAEDERARRMEPHPQAQAERDREPLRVSKAVQDALSAYQQATADLAYGQFDAAANGFRRCQDLLVRANEADGKEVTVLSEHHFMAVAPGASAAAGTAVERDSPYYSRESEHQVGRIYEHRLFVRIRQDKWTFHAQFGKKIAEALRDSPSSSQILDAARLNHAPETTDEIASFLVRLDGAMTENALKEHSEALDETRLRVRHLAMKGEMLANATEKQLEAYRAQLKALKEEQVIQGKTLGDLVKSDFDQRIQAALRAIQMDRSLKKDYCIELKKFVEDFGPLLDSDDSDKLDKVFGQR